MTTLTEQDVRDANATQNLRLLAQTERCSPEAIIAELYEDWQRQEVMGSYQRGVVLLRDYIVLSSDRSVVGGRFDAKTAERIVSPIISVESGHIATSAAYRAVALAQR